jgi:hypothetical protein
MEEMPIAIGIAELTSRDRNALVQPEVEILYYNRQWREVFGFDVIDVLTAAEATKRLYPDPVYRAKMFRLRNKAANESLRSGTQAKPIKVRARVADGSERMFLSGTTVIGNRFMVSMEEVSRHEIRSGGMALTVSRSGSEEVFLEIGSIAGVIADRKYSLVLSGTREYKDRRSIGEWEKILDEQGFERIDRSTLIKVPWIYAVQSHGRGAKVSFAHAAVTIEVGRVGRECLSKLLSVGK